MLRTVLLASAFAACAAAPALAAPAYNWTGFYVGINGGYGGDTFNYPTTGTWVDNNPDPDTDPLTTFSGTGHLTSGGFVGGGQVGYNHQFDTGWILGAEADIDATNIAGRATIAGSSTGGTTGSASASIGSSIDYLGTVRARVGMPVADGRFVPFVSGGLAYGQVTSKATLTITPGGNSQSAPTSLELAQHSTRVGWTLGVGADYAITDMLSFRAEYLYVDLGNKTALDESFNTASNGFNDMFGTDSDETISAKIGAKATANIVRVALNYRFGG